MKKLYSVLLLGLLASTAQAAIPASHCAAKCDVSYNGIKYKICKFACMYGDAVYENDNRWIRSDDCYTILNKKSRKQGLMPACYKGVKIYLNYFR